MQTTSFSKFNIPSIVWASPPPTTTILHRKTTSSWRLSPVFAVASPTAPPSRHSMPPEKLEIIKSLESWVSENVLPLRKPVEKCWQPIEFLPDPSQRPEEFTEEVRALRQRALGLPDEYFVMLVGNMLTEDALPTYQTVFNTLDGVRDESGSSPCPWAIWSRAWTAEENRHGDLLRTYLYLSGRVDMLMVEKTLQYLIGAGMDIGLENNPYLGFVYASFQERATCSSHGNMARLATEGGDPMLARICGTIAADEKRHENAYTRIIEKLLEVDPNATMLAIADMMKKKIIMPMHLMYDGQDLNIFEHFSALTERQGVYTARDYAEILEFFITRWELEKLEGLNGEARRAQDFVCRLPTTVRKLESRAKRLESRQVKFSWIFNKEDIGLENNPYLGFVYASFQERATCSSHGNMARLATEGGDPMLARICGTIAADEKRHENAYTRIIEKLLEVDPNATMLAIADMMKKKIIMPMHLMYDGQDSNIFEHFSALIERQGVYTARDYAEILEFFITRWELEGLNGEARRAQDFVCRLPTTVRKLESRAKRLESGQVKFSWIFNKEVSI